MSRSQSMLPSQMISAVSTISTESPNPSQIKMKASSIHSRHSNQSNASNISISNLDVRQQSSPPALENAVSPTPKDSGNLPMTPEPTPVEEEERNDDEPPCLQEMKVERVPSEDFDEKFGPVPVEVRQAMTAILMLESPEENIVVDALNGLQKFLKKCDANKETFVEIGGLPPIRKKMFDKNPDVQEMSMKILALSSGVHKAKLFVRNEELVKDLLTLSQHGDNAIAGYATFVMSNLATLYTGRLQIAQGDVLPVYIKLLSHSDPDIQRNVLGTIWQIAADPMQTGLLANKEYAEAILKVVNTNEYPPLQAMALMILEKIASRPEGIPILQELDVFNSLIGKLTNESMVDLHRYCLRIIFHECLDRGTCKKYISLVPAIVDIVERTQDPMAKVNGLELLGRLCSVDQIAKGLTQCGVPQLLVNILTNIDKEPEPKKKAPPKDEEDEEEEGDGEEDKETLPGVSKARLKEACALVIAQISRNVFSSKKVFSKCLPILLEMVGNESTSEFGLKCGLIGISSIMEDPTNAIEGFKKGSGFEIFKKFLERQLENSSSSSADAILSALSTIDNIASSPFHRNLVIQANYLAILLKYLQSKQSEQVQVTVCDAICSILNEPSTHSQFLSLKGPEALMNVVEQEEFPVVVASVPIINTVCSNPALCTELLNLGLLQSMWNRTELISRNGPFRACFDKLINSNLSLKYAIVGHVSPFETLENGFCDMGGLKLVDKIKMPKDFTWEDRKRQEKVIMLCMGDSKLDDAVVKNNPILTTGNPQNEINDIIESIKSKKDDFENELALIEDIATAVSDRYGGPLDKWRMTANAEDLEIEGLQNQHKSVVIPTTSITTGSYRIRALVFKALCDACGILCSLETADYKKSWNVVLIRPSEEYMKCPCVDGKDQCDKAFVYTENLKKYVVDLVFQPGLVFPLGSFEADTYMAAI